MKKILIRAGMLPFDNPDIGDIFKYDLFGPVGDDQGFDLGEDVMQPPGKGHIRRRDHRAALYQTAFAHFRIQYAPSHGSQAGIDPQNAHKTPLSYTLIL